MRYDICHRTEIIENGEMVDLDWKAVKRHISKKQVRIFLKQHKADAYQYYVQPVDYIEKWDEWRNSDDEDGINGEEWLIEHGGDK
jgi:SH3-like domain-containing protein